MIMILIIIINLEKARLFCNFCHMDVTISCQRSNNYDNEHELAA